VALVIGYDKRVAGVDKGSESRSDTIMLLRADPDARTISILSFPRDLTVPIAGCKGHPPFTGRINEAYTYCGQKGTLETVRNLTKIKVNYLISVNFRGFVDIVDTVGGVYVDVDRRYFNDNAGVAQGSTYATIDLHPGYQKLSGKQALDYARYRHTDSDFYRIRRQQEFMTAFKQRVSGFSSLTKLPGIVSAITNNVEVSRGGSAAIDVETVYGYAKLAYELPGGNFHQIQIEPEKLLEVSGTFQLSAPDEAVQDVVRQFLNPDVEAAERATVAATGEKPKEPPAPEPATVSIEVLNGNGVAGAADDAAYLLGQRGYPIENGGNADNFSYFESTVLYDPDVEGAERAAEIVGNLFGDADVGPAPTGAELTTMLRVIVGQTFGGTLAPPLPEEAPKREPPVIVRDPDEARPQVRAAQKRVDFPLLLPTVKERSSRLDTEEGVRVYEVSGEPAVKLVYRTGTLEYWGIQQTTWTDAPILSGPSTTRTIKGREYRLYYNGSKLHLVAFEREGAVYWVTNTLLDKLSNETMLAIAKGLQPLAG
jgi:LCP family protein required for cell wall assembly